MKTLSILLVALTHTFMASGQDEILLYRKMYRTADSLKIAGKILDVDTTSVFKKAIELDKQYPSQFFEAMGEYLTVSKFNEASLLFYIGLIRFRYYNSANPKYQASNDGALLASLHYGLGEPINMYLRADVDNFISIVGLSIHYCKENDFVFFPKKNYIEKYNAQIQSFTELLNNAVTNKDRYKEQWSKEKKDMEEKLDQLIEELKEEKN